MANDGVKVIVGLGNPGQAYDTTRHNMGRLIVRSFAQGFQTTFKSKSAYKGQVAKVVMESKEALYLLLPDTFMNLSGLSVRACLKKTGVDLDQCLIVSDDIQVSFGAMRLREKGSHGGA